MELLPEEWGEGVLDVERTRSADGDVSHSLIIRSGVGHRGVVPPSDELLLAVRRLDMLFAERKHPFKALHFTVRASNDGAWDFTVAHTYEDGGDA